MREPGARSGRTKCFFGAIAGYETTRAARIGLRGVGATQRCAPARRAAPVWPRRGAGGKRDQGVCPRLCQLNAQPLKTPRTLPRGLCGPPTRPARQRRAGAAAVGPECMCAHTGKKRTSEARAGGFPAQEQDPAKPRVSARMLGAQDRRESWARFGRCKRCARRDWASRLRVRLPGSKPKHQQRVLTRCARGQRTSKPVHYDPKAKMMLTPRTESDRSRAGKSNNCAGGTTRPSNPIGETEPTQHTFLSKRGLSRVEGWRGAAAGFLQVSALGHLASASFNRLLLQMQSSPLRSRATVLLCVLLQKARHAGAGVAEGADRSSIAVSPTGSHSRSGAFVPREGAQ